MIAVQVQPDNIKVRAATKPMRSHGKGLAEWIRQERIPPSSCWYLYCRPTTHPCQGLLEEAVLATKGCRPKLDFLDCLKAVAERAKLPEERFWLHKFRATFATWSLWAGVDLRTVQQWLGHSDMESTMRYLKPSRSQQVREKVNEIFG